MRLGLGTPALDPQGFDWHVLPTGRVQAVSDEQR